MTNTDPKDANKKLDETASFSIESHYAKQPDGYVYYYWRIVGHDTWNVQKTAMRKVPTVEMVTKTRNKAIEQCREMTAKLNLKPLLGDKK